MQASLEDLRALEASEAFMIRFLLLLSYYLTKGTSMTQKALTRSMGCFLEILLSSLPSATRNGNITHMHALEALEGPNL